MPACQLIVCEKTSHWASALRGALGKRPPRVMETRSLPGCEEALEQSPASVVAIEISQASVEPALAFMMRIKDRFNDAVPVALLSAGDETAGIVLREASAVDVIDSVLDAPRVARLAQKHFAQTVKDQPSLDDFVAELMPWPAQAKPQS